MKFSIKNLFAAALTTIVFTSSAFAASTNPTNAVTVLTQVKNISKLVVNGNVKILLVQAPVESVKVYNSYYANNALVQQENGELRISSFEKETLTVAVYVRNLNTIELNDNASVKTYGKINFLSLDLKLNGSATADINANTISLTTVLKDNASLNLSGATTDLYATLNAKAKINMDQFKANNTSVSTTAPMYAKVNNVKKQTLENIVLADQFTK